MSAPLVLDLDGAVGPLPGARVLPLRAWQDAVRFGCGVATLERLARELQPALESAHGTVMLGSGDFHHLTWPLVRQAAARHGGPLQVVVLDNHPDNMRYPFGVHCGSWVRRVAALPQVTRVHMVGLCSADAGTRHCWENVLGPLRAGRVHYWCLGVDTRWARTLGCGHAVHGFADSASLLDAFAARADAALPVYLSIDKDVFGEDVARTNWDQGRFQLADARRLIDELSAPIVASDITGEISHHRYRQPFKRLLSALDGQQPPDPNVLPLWQAGQHALNAALLPLIAAASVAA
ncbi:arginase family protein [Pseudoxanthomonas winnipegensis]|uniref:arginase family protein n=1 Tax=Pseudoxanthomonas winnipegensis TaxID=2480810 RepID=UPI00257577BF|nr:arginase family protein [Pseudoxanthomonas winnipegensis]WJI15412.1 arginase family protein [Pseudoxanthomonas winnipegensis]